MISAAARHFDYGTGTHCGRPFNAVRLYRACQRVLRQKYVGVPQPRPCNARRLSHMIGLASSAFARHYSRNHMLFSLPVGTEMFHFPTFPLPALYIQAGVTGSHKYAQRGFPIRTSSDQSSLINSPRLIADCYVLLRLQMPRHPPSALRNLTTKIKIAIDSNNNSTRRLHHRHERSKMLASTV